MNLKFFLLFIVITLIVVPGCKKYEDGPLFSFYSKEHRVVGEWDVEYFEINGVDSTSYLKSQPLYGTYSFSKEKEGRAGFLFYSNDHTYSSDGLWTFTDHKKKIQINTESNFTGVSFHIGPFAANSELWEIRRLTEKELWLKTIYDGREYFVKFKLK